VATSIHRITALIAVALALALGASTASAAFVNMTAGGTSVRVPSYAGPVSTGAPNTQPTTASAPAASGGFDWGDAGIGAVAGVGLSLVCIGGALATTHRRSRRPRRTTAFTS
jgi:hypothetical protein